MIELEPSLLPPPGHSRPPSCTHRGQTWNLEALFNVDGTPLKEPSRQPQITDRLTAFHLKFH